MGNYAVNCPSSTVNTHTGTQSLQVGHTMNQTTNEAPTTNIIKPKYILLDTCSTIIFIRKQTLVQKIQPCDAGEKLRTYTNDGHQDYDHTATLNCYLLKFFLKNNHLKNTLLFRSGFQVQDHHQHWILPVHNCTPSRWHKDSIQEMRGSSLLFWHNKWGFWRRANHILHIPQHSR